MSSAESEKELGSEEWKKGNYEKAIEHFSKAIDNTTDRELTKILYSNRSAANLQLKRNAEALIDAKKCVELDCNWAKGQTRLGDALFASRKYTEAYNAYNAGLRISPSDKNLSEKAEKAMNAISGESNSSSSSSGSGWGNQSSYAQSAAPTTGILGTIQTYGRYFMIGNALLYLVPLGQFSLGCYRRFVFSAIVGYLLEVYLKHGLPALSFSALAPYAQRVLPDPVVMRLFLAFLLISTKPYILALGSLLLFELTTFTTKFFEYARNQLPAIEGQLSGLLARFAPGMGAQNLSALLSPSNIHNVNNQLIRLSTQCEVYQGLFLIFELILPSRNFMFLFLWWQYLQMRYMLDLTGNVKSIFYTLDQQISQLLSHAMCPAIVRKGYALVKSQLAERVKMPSSIAQESPSPSFSSMMSKCSVM